MLNTFMCVGRLVSDTEIKETENGKVGYITLAVNRNFKNNDGIYETDFIPVEMYSGMSEQVKEYCRKGDLISIKGYLQNNDNKLIVIADKVVFLSSKPNKEEE